MTNWHSSGSSNHERNAKGNYAACWGAFDYRTSAEGNEFYDTTLAGFFGVNMIKNWHDTGKAIIQNMRG